MKLESLKQILTSLKSVLVAYSGGVDSTFLLKISKDVLGDNVTAVTATSIIYPFHETEAARAITKKLSIRHVIIKNEALLNPNFTENPPERCYWCKKELFLKMISLAKEYHINCVIDGSNDDDINDFRPGLRATIELGIRSPLKEAGLKKDEIRRLSKKLDLPTWNKPSDACLASRFPYGTKITEANIRTVDKAESFLRKMGIIQLRVRHHNQTARIEVVKDDIPKFLNEKTRQEVLSYFKKLGYTYVTLDLAGYRTGSMNEVL